MASLKQLQKLKTIILFCCKQLQEFSRSSLLLSLLPKVFEHVGGSQMISFCHPYLRKHFPLFHHMSPPSLQHAEKSPDISLEQIEDFVGAKFSTLTTLFALWQLYPEGVDGIVSTAFPKQPMLPIETTDFQNWTPKKKTHPSCPIENMLLPTNSSSDGKVDADAAGGNLGDLSENIGDLSENIGDLSENISDKDYSRVA